MCLSLKVYSSTSQIVASKDRNLSLEWKPVRGSTQVGSPALPAIIRVGYKRLTMAAYNGMEIITIVNSFKVQAPRSFTTKLLASTIFSVL